MDNFMANTAKQFGFWDSIIIEILGVVFAFNAVSSDEYTGAGVCLAASA